MYLLKKIEEMKVRFDQSGELSFSDKSFIESMYERILSRRFNRQGCGQCYRDAFIEIYLQVQKNGIKDMGKFILKREELVHIAGNAQVYTRANITDDVAAMYLKQFPNAINRFESYPDDWQKTVAECKSQATSNAPVEDAAEQIAAEKALIADIVQMQKEGTSKNKIKEQYKLVEKVGQKNLTGMLLSEFMKQADQIIKA